MPLHTLLWVDLTRTVREAELPEAFSRWFDVTACPEPELGVPANMVDKFQCACFDFDYPDRDGLRLMQASKEAFPQMPILMLTTQHSEALAIWSFRARIWDYLVKPVSGTELRRTAESLSDMVSRKSAQRERKVFRPIANLPDEVRMDVHHSADLQLLPAISFVEKHFGRKIHLNDVAEMCQMSVFRFSRVFHSIYGITFQEYLQRCRIREACRLLDNPDAGIADVTFITGFNDPSYFARVFKRYMNMVPSDWAHATDRPEIPSLAPVRLAAPGQTQPADIKKARERMQRGPGSLRGRL